MLLNLLLKINVKRILSLTQHTISPYIENSTRLAKNALNYVSNQSSSAFSNLVGSSDSGIPFHTWANWQWSWFLENCRSWINSLKQSLALQYNGMGQFFESVLNYIQQKLYQLQSMLSYQIIQKYLSAVDQSHIYFLLSGIAIGFIIGIQIKRNVKPLTRMRALVCNSYAGAPESMIAMIDDMVAPNSCGAEDVMIQVKASSIDPIDIKITFGYGKVIRSQYHHYHKVLETFLKICLSPFYYLLLLFRHMGRICSFHLF